MELLKDVTTPVYPVGRLDVDSEGLLILTNDGDFTFQVTHPSHETPKTYMVETRGRLTVADIYRLTHGIELEDGKTAPAMARVIGFDRRTAVSRVELTIHEGKKRQVRRMFDALNHPIQRLARIRIGEVTITGLEPGHWRMLTKSEVGGLLKKSVREAVTTPRGRSRQ